jgi:anti-sigma regulatory factor (Ser/Thr protein kinase)
VGAANGQCREHASTAGPFAGRFDPSPSGAREFSFGCDGLHELRGLVAGESAAAGLSPARATDLVLAASELAANSVRHGGGAGTSRCWREPGTLVVEVSDAGRIEEPLVGRLRPAPTQEGGRGLWMANQVCDLVRIRSGETGTAVRLHMSLN